jgi:hypothetical protein
MGDVGNVVELHGGYKFVNMSGSWFGLVCELQVVKVRYSETVTASHLAKIAKSQNSL